MPTFKSNEIKRPVGKGQEGLLQSIWNNRNITAVALSGKGVRFFFFFFWGGVVGGMVQDIFEGFK